jgi:hypothetical protein
MTRDDVVRRTVELAEIRGEHTPDEWIDTSQLGTGLRCAAATITGWERGAREGGGA